MRPFMNYLTPAEKEYLPASWQEPGEADLQLITSEDEVIVIQREVLLQRSARGSKWSDLIEGEYTCPPLKDSLSLPLAHLNLVSYPVVQHQLMDLAGNQNKAHVDFNTASLVHMLRIMLLGEEHISD